MLLKNKGKTLLFSILKQGRRTKAEVQVYGSRVNGRVCFSDLGLVLRSQGKPIDIDEFINFKNGLKKSNISFLADALNWKRIPDCFKDNINQQ